MHPLRWASVALDLLLIVAVAAMLVIVATGGGIVSVGDHVVRAHSIGNLVAFVALWTLIRYTLRGVPFLLRPSLSLADAPQRALLLIASHRAAIERLGARRAAAIVAGVAIAMLAVKVGLVVGHPGFFSGDDLEIHEMTLKALFDTPWPIWDLRSPFFPMVFIYPVQWTAHRAGLTDVAHLVMAGRLVVTVLSTVTVPILYLYARHRGGVATAAIAAVLLATSSLYTEFGATELPRAVGALFVVAAFGTLTTTRHAGAAVAGGTLLAIAACLRFSEVVFLAPALLCLALDRRWLHVLLVGVAWTATAGTIQVLSDIWYWGEPLHSVRAIVDFTLVQRLSSRGVDPWWYYVREATAWSDVLVLGLALYGSRRDTRLALWVWLPIVALSALPHKEPRYLVPVTPLLCLLAAQGALVLLRTLDTRRDKVAAAVAAALVVAAPLRFLDQASKYRITRSDDEVAVARELGPSLGRGPIVVEQNWRFGGHLYWPADNEIVEVGADDAIATVSRLTAAGERPSAIALTERTCRLAECAPAFERLGFVRTARANAIGSYLVYLPARAAQLPSGF